MVIKLYIDLALIKFLENKKFRSTDTKPIIENCGIWRTPDQTRDDMGEPNATLEEMFDDHYFVIEDNKILFCSVEQMIDDIDEYVEEVILNENKF